MAVTKHFSGLFRLLAIVAFIVLLDPTIFLVLEVIFERFSVFKTFTLFQTALTRMVECMIFFILYKPHLLSILGLESPGKVVKHLCWGIGLSLLGLGLFLGLDFISIKMEWGSLKTLLTGQETPQTVTWSDAIVFIMIGGLLGPFAEEFFFRGILIHALPMDYKKLVSFIPYTLLLTFIFVIPHIDLNPVFNHSSTDASFKTNLVPTLKSQSSYIFIWSTCAFVMIGLYQFTRSIFCGWMIHCNANIALYLIAHGFF